ncbi:MAG: RNA methyltransferase [Sulfuricellaceae bacterium]
MKKISSRDNLLFKQLKKLAASARERKKTQKTLLDGVHLVTVYLDRVGIPEMSAVSASMLEKPEIQAIMAQLPENRLAILEDGLFGEISTVESATGIVAVIPLSPPLAIDADFCVMLEAIQDPGNLGSILRSAAAAGCGLAYLSPDCVDAWSPKALRAGMGAHFSLALRENADLVKAATEFPGLVLATSPNARKSLYDCDLTGGLAIIVGNEGAGISPRLLDAANEKVLIPMPGGAESLNAAAAAAICLFERVRQILISGVRNS